jgi:hypothetical protein
MEFTDRTEKEKSPSPRLWIMIYERKRKTYVDWMWGDRNAIIRFANVNKIDIGGLCHFDLDELRKDIVEKGTEYADRN